MRYRLRTLLIVLAIGPQVLAWLWFYWPSLIWWCAGMLIALGIATATAAVAAIPIAALAFVFARVADVILYVGRNADNRR